jgi:signal transduction histidine kinase
MQLQAASELPDSQSQQRRACIVRAEDLARTGLRQVREFVHTLTVNGEDRWKAVEVMRKFVSDTTAGTGIAGTFVVRGTERLLKASVSHALQRILQEAVGNAQRYADATSIETVLQFEEESVRMTISDNGTGFDAASVNDSGFGIPGMRTRVARLAGTFSLDTHEGRGTTITVRLPDPYEEAFR